MNWMRRARGAVGMGLTWAAAWAVAGLLIGVASKLLPGLPWGAFFEVFDAPLPAMAVPGFVAGALFSVVLGIAGRRRRFHELSLARFAALGALGGLLLTLFPFALIAVGLASTEGSSFSPGHVFAVIVGPFVLLSALSAAGSLWVARKAEHREETESGLAGGAAREMLGEGDASLHGRPAAPHGERVRPDAARHSSE